MARPTDPAPRPSSAQGALDILSQFGSPPAGASPNKVFMGTESRTAPLARGHSQETDRSALGTNTTTFDTWKTADQAKAAIYAWGSTPDTPDLVAFQKAAYAAGLYGQAQPAYGVVDAGTEQIWNRLVDQAASYYAAGRKLSPFDVLGMYGAMGQGGSTTHTSTSTSVHLSTITEAKGVLDQVFKKQLGRAVTDREAKNFLGALQGQERANPSVSKTTTVTDPSGNSTSTGTSTDAGFDPSQYAQDYSRQKYGREIDTRTIGVDYYHAALQAIGALA